jgi:RNA polymerase sigma-70 factor (ECF subfamily)
MGAGLNAIGNQRDVGQVNAGEGEEARLIAGVLGKNRKATAEFVGRYTDAVYVYVHSRLAPQQDHVDDLVQDILVAAWENLGQYRGASSLQGWVIGIARHKVEDHYRARLRAPEPIGDADSDPELPVSFPEFDHSLDLEQLRKKTWGILRGLPEQYRLALIWRYWEDASAREMAAKTGKTEKAIERLLARARVEFRERWNHA